MPTTTGTLPITAVLNDTSGRPRSELRVIGGSPWNSWGWHTSIQVETVSLLGSEPKVIVGWLISMSGRTVAVAVSP